MKKEPKNYVEAMKELEMLVQDLQAELVSIDDMAAKSKRAAELIQWCKTKLRETESEIGKIFETEAN
ncbi:MAG: exodeoxyribonuclease VII small subunit [Saprospiraceae bacterium]